VLAVCELDGDGTDEQLLQPDSQDAFAGTNDDDGCVRGFRKLAQGPGQVAGERPEGPSDSGAVQGVLKTFPDAGTGGFNVVNEPVVRLVGEGTSKIRKTSIGHYLQHRGGALPCLCF
jgi:hypothetical protein